MGTLVSTTHSGIQEGIALHSMVDRLVAGIVPMIVRQNSFIVNEIPPGLNVVAHPETVNTVLENLFFAVATHAEYSCIRVSSKEYGYLVIVHLRKNNTTSPYTIAGSLQEIIPLAEKIGGYIGVSSHAEREMTIVFSFSNAPIAA